MQLFVARKCFGHDLSTVAHLSRALTCGRDWNRYVDKGFSDLAKLVLEFRTREDPLGSLYV